MARLLWGADCPLSGRIPEKADPLQLARFIRFVLPPVMKVVSVSNRCCQKPCGRQMQCGGRTI